MAQFVFGTGQVYAMPVGGGAPLRFGALQGVSLDISADIKELFGQNQFALAVARGKTKVEGKAMTGEINPSIYNQAFFSGVAATGQKVPIFNEAGTIPATPYIITVAQGATFYMDLGVFDAVTGVAYTQVPSGTPTTGQYKVNTTTGAYTFAAVDTTKTVVISYLYTSTTTGQTMNLTNSLMGVAPTFQLVLTEVFNGKTFVLVLYSCTSSKFSLPFKQDDFMVSELDFSAQDNGSGAIGFISASL